MSAWPLTWLPAPDPAPMICDARDQAAGQLVGHLRACGFSMTDRVLILTSALAHQLGEAPRPEAVAEAVAVVIGLLSNRAQLAHQYRLDALLASPPRGTA